MAEQNSGTVQLRKNSIGLLHIVFFVVAAAAPLMAVVGATPAAFAFGNGPGVAGAFILAGALYLVFSVGFTSMSRYVGSAGAFYTYITQGLGKPIGVGAALIAVLTYNAIQIAVYGLFAVFVNAALTPFGVNLPWWIYSILAIAVVTLCGQRQIAFSGNLLGVCMLAEIALLLLLDVAVVLHGGGPEGISLSSFAPSTVFGPGLGVSLVFVIGSYIGFEATAIFSEEAHNPERTIPRATYVAVFLITAFYALSTWAIAQAYGPSLIAAAAKDNIETLYLVQTNKLLGAWAADAIERLVDHQPFRLCPCVPQYRDPLFLRTWTRGLGLAWAGSHSCPPRFAGNGRPGPERYRASRCGGFRDRRTGSLCGGVLLDDGARSDRHHRCPDTGLPCCHRLLPA